MEVKLTELEVICKRQVEKAFGRPLWAEYEVARGKVFTELLPFIRIREPFLTDHGPDHIVNVFNNAYALLGKDQCVAKDTSKSLSVAELYLLVLSILFHDVGNVFSRKGHKSRLQEAYEFAKGNAVTLAQERRLLFNIVEAHGGETRHGSHDTIGPLEKQDVIMSQRVDCQRIAAILRFADELAEGPQRTSIFMQHYLEVPDDSQVYHDYSGVCDMHISPEDERIAVVYDIEMRPPAWGSTYDASRLRKLLEFCFMRLSKLDKERKYNRHYCSLLHRFKRTDASFHFHLMGKDLHLDLPHVVLDDLVLPNSIDPTEIATACSAMDLDLLMTTIEKAASAAPAQPPPETPRDAH